MAYIGRQLVRGQNRILDDISSSFNGSTTAFNLTVSSSSSPPASVNQLWIIIGGILQKPGTDFTVADAVITFTTAPASTLSFWGMIQGDTSDINSPADASVTPSKIANSGDFAFPADVRFKDADGSHYVGLQAPSTVSSNLVWSLPAADGSANQLLKTDGSGNLGWVSDTQSNLLDEDNMSSNSATQPASQQSIKAYADTKAVLTGSTNNTITTVTGAHAIQGEANLTYDGSHLSIATDAHGEGIKLTASGSTYNGITFDANRSGADEYMGALEAKWNGSLVSFISFETGDDTTNKDDGLIAFSTRTSGSSIAERMRLDTAGRLLLGAGSVALPKGSGAGSVDLDNGSITMCVGGNINSTGRTNSTDKLNRITTPHYTNAEEPCALISGYSSSADNNIHYGGGSSSTNAVTKHSFWTAADNTTTTGSEVFRIQSDKNVKVIDGDLIIGTSGHGIDFSATGDATGSGISMQGELLDDYERGTWGSINTGADSCTFTHNWYVKVGRLVTCNVRLSGITNGNGSALTLNLPFANGTVEAVGAVACDTFNMPSDWVLMNSYAYDGKLYVLASRDNAGWENLLGNMTATNTTIILNITYLSNT